MPVLEAIAKIGIMGAAALIVIGTVAGLAVYGFVHNPDSDLTKQLVAVLVMGAGGLLTQAGKFFGKD